MYDNQKGDEASIPQKRVVMLRHHSCHNQQENVDWTTCRKDRLKPSMILLTATQLRLQSRAITSLQQTSGTRGHSGQV